MSVIQNKHVDCSSIALFKSSSQHLETLLGFQVKIPRFPTIYRLLHVILGTSLLLSNYLITCSYSLHYARALIVA